ncbi:GDSL esterase/lipase [Chloropicon roscoffensis]|uniref:GDSL esterase/lipase n=1 Tax=Chloropicon roscoffensis TaxID=1461544 RepID=A0AAX4PG71_9CHLO
MAMRRTKIVLFGDSITQQAFSTKHSGWAAAVNDAYQRKVDIVNRGYSGYNTRWASQLVHEVSSHFASGSPANGRDILTIFFGANDASLADGTAAAQHVPIAEYKANLGKLIDFVRSDHGSRAPQIVLITPPPVHERSWAKFCGEETSNRSLEQSRAYAAACKEVAAEKGLPVVDSWSALHSKAQGDLEGLFWDGLHLSARGNTLLFEALMGVILGKLPGLAPDALPLDAPLWRDIDPKNYESSFRAARF